MNDMSKIEAMNGSIMITPDTFMVNVEEFERETDANDGDQLIVVDEENDKVVNYCVAFHGIWYDLVRTEE